MGKATASDGSDHIARGLVRLMMAVDDAYSQVSREVGLTAQQAQLLCAAQRAAPVRDIAAFLRWDRSNVSHLADRVAGRGLLQRRAAETDGRVKLIELSPEGRDVVQRFIETLGSRFEAVLAGWPEDRQRDALATLHALADALERGPEDAVRDDEGRAGPFP